MLYVGVYVNCALHDIRALQHENFALIITAAGFTRAGNYRWSLTTAIALARARLQAQTNRNLVLTLPVRW
jgi:hypothetical protein